MQLYSCELKFEAKSTVFRFFQQWRLFEPVLGNYMVNTFAAYEGFNHWLQWESEQGRSDSQRRKGLSINYVTPFLGENTPPPPPHSPT